MLILLHSLEEFLNLFKHIESWLLSLVQSTIHFLWHHQMVIIILAGFKPKKRKQQLPAHFRFLSADEIPNFGNFSRCEGFQILATTRRSAVAPRNVMHSGDVRTTVTRVRLTAPFYRYNGFASTRSDVRPIVTFQMNRRDARRSFLGPNVTTLKVVCLLLVMTWNI